MADPRFPYLWAGVTFQSDGTTVQPSVALTLTNERTGDQLNATSATDGTYVFDLAGLDSGFSEGDLINVVASGSGTKGKVLKFKAFGTRTSRIPQSLSIAYTSTET